MNQLKTNLNQIEAGYVAVIKATKTGQQLTTVKSSYLGKNGSIQVILRGLSKLEAGQRREIGSLRSTAEAAEQGRG